MSTETEVISFRAAPGTLDRIKSFRRPGETMGGVVIRAFNALGAESVLPLESPAEDWRVALTQQLASLTMRLAALEELRLDSAHDPHPASDASEHSRLPELAPVADTVEQPSTPEAMPTSSVVKPMSTPEPTAPSGIPHPYRDDPNDPYPDETKRLAVQALRDNFHITGRELSQLIETDCGKAPSASYAKKLVTKWEARGAVEVITPH